MMMSSLQESTQYQKQVQQHQHQLHQQFHQMKIAVYIGLYVLCHLLSTCKSKDNLPLKSFTTARKSMSKLVELQNLVANPMHTSQFLNCEKGDDRQWRRQVSEFGGI